MRSFTAFRACILGAIVVHAGFSPEAFARCGDELAQAKLACEKETQLLKKRSRLGAQDRVVIDRAVSKLIECEKKSMRFDQRGVPEPFVDEVDAVLARLREPSCNRVLSRKRGDALKRFERMLTKRQIGWFGGPTAPLDSYNPNCRTFAQADEATGRIEIMMFARQGFGKNASAKNPYDSPKPDLQLIGTLLHEIGHFNDSRGEDHFWGAGNLRDDVRKTTVGKQRTAAFNNLITCACKLNDWFVEPQKDERPPVCSDRPPLVENWACSGIRGDRYQSSGKLPRGDGFVCRNERNSRRKVVKYARACQFLWLTPRFEVKPDGSVNCVVDPDFVNFNEVLDSPLEVIDPGEGAVDPAMPSSGAS